MNRVDVTEIITKISSRYPKWFLDDFIQGEWEDEFYSVFSHCAKDWVWERVSYELGNHSGDYPPALPKLIKAVGMENARIERDRLKELPAPGKEPRIPQDQAAANMAKIQEIVQKAIPEKRGPSDMYQRVTSQRSDDLEIDGEGKIIKIEGKVDAQ